MHSAYGKAWQFRRFREPENVGSNPTAPTRLRWGLCWYGQAPVKRYVAGSIPAAAAQVFGHGHSAGRKRSESLSLLRASCQLRGRLTVGLDALNVAMLVRFQPPQLDLEGQANGRWQLSRKQSSDEPCEFDSHPFRLSTLAGSSNGRMRRPERRDVGPILTPATLNATVPWSNGNDSCLTNRKRWFNSIRDYYHCGFRIAD
jgi:hypothetical protein